MDTKRKGLFGLPSGKGGGGSGKQKGTGGTDERKGRGKTRTLTVLIIVSALLLAGLPAALLGRGNRKAGPADVSNVSEESGKEPVAVSGIGPADRTDGFLKNETEEPDCLVLLPEPETGTGAVSVSVVPLDGKRAGGDGPDVSSTATGSDVSHPNGGTVVRLEPETSVRETDGTAPAEGKPAEIRYAVDPDGGNPFETDGNGVDESSELPEKDGKDLFGKDRPGEGKAF